VIDMATFKISSRWIVIGGAVLLAALASALVLAGAARQASAASYSALSASPGSASAANDSSLVGLAKSNPNLDLSNAREVLVSAESTVWLSTAHNGDICLLETLSGALASPDPRMTIDSRFACSNPTDAAKNGVIGGTPGHFYGVVPDGVATVAAEVDGKLVPVPIANNAFRLPADASSVVVGDANPIALPARR
jgi:hypothetical protein